MVGHLKISENAFYFFYFYVDKILGENFSEKRGGGGQTDCDEALVSNVVPPEVQLD